MKKIAYYNKLFASSTKVRRFKKTVWDSFINPFNVNESNRGLSFLERYEGPHPQIIYEMSSQLANESYPMHPRHEVIDRYLDSPYYYLDRLIAKTFNDLLFKRRSEVCYCYFSASDSNRAYLNSNIDLFSLYAGINLSHIYPNC